MNEATFTADLDPQELEALRKLSALLGCTLTTGWRAGDGSPRQLLKHLARAVRIHGLERTAETIKPLMPE